MKCYVCQRNKRIAGIYIGGKAVCEECLELAERYRDLCSAMAKRLELSIEKNQGNKAYKCIHCSNFHLDGERENAVAICLTRNIKVEDRNANPEPQALNCEQFEMSEAYKNNFEEVGE